MKKLINCLLLLVSVLALNSCQTQEEENGNYNEVKLNIKITPFDIYTTDFQKAVSAADAVKTIAVAIYDSEGNSVYTTSQKSTDENFGTVTASVKAGTLTVEVVGYGSSTAPTFVSSKEVDFTGDRLYDTFSGSKSVTVGNSSSEDISMTLERVVSCFRVAFTDDIPDDAKTIVTTFSKGGKTQLNPISGTSCTDTGSSYSKSISTSKIYDTYTFLGTDEEKMDITVDIKNAEGKTAYSRSFQNVVLKRDRATVAAGAMFTASASGTFTFNNTWQTEVTINW